MIVFEFYLKADSKDLDFEVLCSSFYSLGLVKRAFDAVVGSCIYSVSRNSKTSWVQLLVDDNTLQATLDLIETQVDGLSDWNDRTEAEKSKTVKHAKSTSNINNVAPKERSKEETLKVNLPDFLLPGF